MRKLLLFSVIVIVALAMVGISSAAWSVQSTLQGTVTTGSVDGHFAHPWVIQLVPPSHGHVTASVSADGHTLTVSLPKSNKDYSTIVMFSVTNVGTIPLKVRSIESSAPSHVSVSPFGEGTTIGAGDSAGLLGLWISVSKKARLPSVVTVTLDCCVWLQ